MPMQRKTGVKYCYRPIGGVDFLTVGDRFALGQCQVRFIWRQVIKSRAVQRREGFKPIKGMFLFKHFR